MVRVVRDSTVVGLVTTQWLGVVDDLVKMKLLLSVFEGQFACLLDV